MQVDVSSDESIAAFAKFVLGRGEVHVLVNGAGFGKGQPFVDNDPAFWNASSISTCSARSSSPEHCWPDDRSAIGQDRQHRKRRWRVGSSGETVYSGAKAA